MARIFLSAGTRQRDPAAECRTTKYKPKKKCKMEIKQTQHSMLQVSICTSNAIAVFLNVLLVSDTVYSIENCGDDAKYNTFFFSVRAVNKDESGKILEGPWSDELESYCRSPPTILIYMIVLPVVVSCIGLFWLAKK